MAKRNRNNPNRFSRSEAPPVDDDTVDDDTRDVLRALLGDRMLFSNDETAKILGKSLPWLYRMQAAGLIQYVHYGGRRATKRRVIARVLTEGVGQRMGSNACPASRCPARARPVHCLTRH
jgi:hypothetical protein